MKKIILLLLIIVFLSHCGIVYANQLQPIANDFMTLLESLGVESTVTYSNDCKYNYVTFVTSDRDIGELEITCSFWTEKEYVSINMSANNFIALSEKQLYNLNFFQAINNLNEKYPFIRFVIDVKRKRLVAENTIVTTYIKEKTKTLCAFYLSALLRVCGEVYPLLMQEIWK